MKFGSGVPCDTKRQRELTEDGERSNVHFLRGV